MLSIPHGGVTAGWAVSMMLPKTGPPPPPCGDPREAESCLLSRALDCRDEGSHAAAAGTSHVLQLNLLLSALFFVGNGFRNAVWGWMWGGSAQGMNGWVDQCFCHRCAATVLLENFIFRIPGKVFSATKHRFSLLAMSRDS